MTTRYVACSELEVPFGVRFDVPCENQGQMIEVAYGTFLKYEAHEGGPYKRVVDRAVAGAFATSGSGVTYYRKVPK